MGLTRANEFFRPFAQYIISILLLLTRIYLTIRNIARKELCLIIKY